jgi:hypothetical protein
VTGPAKLPPVTGGGVRALWQGAPWAYLTFAGGTLFGVGGQLHQVHAITAATGKPLWTATLPKSVPFILGLVPAGSVLVVEAGRHSGLAGLSVYEYLALDAKTGKTRWTVPGGDYQAPPIAASGKYLLTGDTSDAVTGRIAATGAVAWRDPRPAACGPPTGRLPVPRSTAGGASSSSALTRRQGRRCGPTLPNPHPWPTAPSAKWSPSVLNAATTLPAPPRCRSCFPA